MIYFFLLLLCRSYASFDRWTHLPHVPSLPYVIESSYTHPRSFFTQGLSYHHGHLYESIGLYHHSALIDYQFPNQLPSIRELSPHYFAEGITKIGNRIFQLTWQNHQILTHEKDNIQHNLFLKHGWGLTSINNNLVYTDGSSHVYFQWPTDLLPWKTIQIHDQFGPINQLNDLCFHQGWLFINIWFSDVILIASPENGQVVSYIDLSLLRNLTHAISKKDVLNGITSLSDHQILVTGKNWPCFYQIKTPNIIGPWTK